MDGMGWILFVAAAVFYAIVDTSIRSKSEKIANAESSEDAIEERKSLKRMLKYSPIFGLFMGAIPTNYHETLEQVSDETMDSFRSRSRRFALYLRAFHNDRYSSREVDYHLVGMNMEGDDLEHGSFSEKAFADEMESFINTYAVGMSKEVVHPDGSRRIYLDDDTWQEDVIELMEQATLVFVLMENRESCIWELQQSMDRLEKAYYIVDDVEMYMAMKRDLDLSLPEIPLCMSKARHFIFHWQDGRFVIQPFLNTKSDYNVLAFSINNCEFGNAKVDMNKGLYDGLGRIWVASTDSAEFMKEQLGRLVQLKQQFCPMAIFDLMTLCGCAWSGHQIDFQLQVDELDLDQREFLHETFCYELSLPKNRFFVSVLKELKVDICHKIVDPKSLMQMEIVIQSTEL